MGLNRNIFLYKVLKTNILYSCGLLLKTFGYSPRAYNRKGVKRLFKKSLFFIVRRLKSWL